MYFYEDKVPLDETYINVIVIAQSLYKVIYRRMIIACDIRIQSPESYCFLFMKLVCEMTAGKLESELLL